MYISLSVPHNLTQAISFNKRNNPNILSKIFNIFLYIFFQRSLLRDTYSPKRKFYVLVVNIYELNTGISV